MGVVDVDEILEHQLNANMLSMPYDVYSELFDAVDGLGVEIENLQSENAKLRVERDEWRRVAVSKQDIIDHMRDANAENAKLRELARGLGQCAQGVDCEDCLLYDLSEPDHCREERLSRELGIEVGE